MNARAFRLVVFAQICLYAGVLLAVLLKPQGLAANSGISYYGIYARTIIPMATGLLSAAFLSWRAALYIERQDLRPIKYGLAAFAILTVVIVVTPYSFDGIADDLHTTAGSMLFSLQLLLSIWMIVKLHYKSLAIFLTLVELGAGIACAYYLHPAHGLLIQFQLLFQLAFGLLLVYSIAKLKVTDKAVLP